MVKVFNVKQGDSFLIHPDCGCVLNDIPLLVDCGPKNGKVYSKIHFNEIDVLITHSHIDHIGGLQDITSKIRNLYIPYFLPEVWSIFNYLKKYLFEDILNVELIKNQFKRVVVVGEGDGLCTHLQIYNPPKKSNNLFNKVGLEGTSIDNALRFLNFLGVEIPNEDDIINYQSIIVDLENVIFYNDQNDQSYGVEARKYVHGFFISLADGLAEYEDIVDFNVVINHIRKKFQDLIHRSCIVLKYKYEGYGVILFTGDADEYAFDRIIGNGWDISSDYLKVPHHGSRENLTLELMKKINPKTAIFTHNNRKFGRSKDTHPHYEVLDYCNALGVQMCFTNDVKKVGGVLYPATTGFVDGFIEFV